MPVDDIEEHLREGWVVCTARVSGRTAGTPRARVLERIDVFHGEVPERFEILYDWFDPSRAEGAYNVRLVLGRDHLFLLRPDETVPGRFALAGASWMRNQPVEYFERHYPEFFPSLPAILRTERIGDDLARLGACLRLVDAGDELAGYAVRRILARWKACTYPRDRLVMEEMEEALRGLCSSSSRDWRIRHYAMGRIAAVLRHEGEAMPSDLYEVLCECAAREPESALRWRAAATLRWLAGARRLVPRGGGFLAILDACVAALLAEKEAHVAEELARAVAVLGPAGDAAIAPLDRGAEEVRFLAAAIREHWLAEDGAVFDPNRFTLRR